TEALVDAAHVDRATTERELDAVSPAFTEGVTRYGQLEPSELRAWAAWEARFGITKRPPDVARAFAPGF
ncbi:MAG: putative hydroxymethylpyrimidine transport system substrate-binding protein, partial [Solirubrobacteraceae bacterium]|nr:putative hydroxymethylpyrimidine transport system substrate-binding protein [Solirubrobacteraceae bacterium]